MTRVLKLDRLHGGVAYIDADSVVSVEGYDSTVYLDLGGGSVTAVSGPADVVAARIWPDLDKPPAPVVSDEDVARIRSLVALEGLIEDHEAWDRILAALGR